MGIQICTSKIYEKCME